MGFLGPSFGGDVSIIRFRIGVMSGKMVLGIILRNFPQNLNLSKIHEAWKAKRFSYSTIFPLCLVATNLSKNIISFKRCRDFFKIISNLWIYSKNIKKDVKKKFIVAIFTKRSRKIPFKKEQEPISVDFLFKYIIRRGKNVFFALSPQTTKFYFLYIILANKLLHG